MKRHGGSKSKFKHFAAGAALALLVVAAAPAGADYFAQVVGGDPNSGGGGMMGPSGGGSTFGDPGRMGDPNASGGMGATGGSMGGDMLRGGSMGGDMRGGSTGGDMRGGSMGSKMGGQGQQGGRMTQGGQRGATGGNFPGGGATGGNFPGGGATDGEFPGGKLNEGRDSAGKVWDEQRLGETTSDDQGIILNEGDTGLNGRVKSPRDFGTQNEDQFGTKSKVRQPSDRGGNKSTKSSFDMDFGFEGATDVGSKLNKVNKGFGDTKSGKTYSTKKTTVRELPKIEDNQEDLTNFYGKDAKKSLKAIKKLNYNDQFDALLDFFDAVSSACDETDIAEECGDSDAILQNFEVLQDYRDADGLSKKEKKSYKSELKKLLNVVSNYQKTSEKAYQAYRTELESEEE